MAPNPFDTAHSRPIHELSDREILILMCERQEVANTRIDRLNGKCATFESRITTLEMWRTFLAGAWAVIVLLAAALTGKK